ncbi:MAG: hypothetical protein AB1505_21645, partial [Candidatus Latescibacterota bacterium]
MKTNRTLLLLLAILACWSVACTPPPVDLTHRPQATGYEYPAKGTLRILPFTDARPPKELKIKTVPSVSEFVRSTVVQEVTQSGLFSVVDADGADFELTGTVSALRVASRRGALGYVGA